MATTSTHTIRKITRPYIEQLHRLESANDALQGFKKITDDNLQSAIQSAEYFFLIAGHMRDWVKASGINQQEIDKFIAKNYELGVVRNVSLKIKHYSVSRPSANELANFGIGFSIPIGRNWDYFENKGTLTLLVDGKEVTILDIAKIVVSLWQIFLENH